MMNTEHTPFGQKPRITLHFRESGSQRGKGGDTGFRRSNPDPEYYRQLIQQAPNPFWGTDDVQMSNDLISPVQSGIKDARHFDDTLNVFHGDKTNGSTADRREQNDETGTTDRGSLTVAPLRWQVRRGLASSQAPSPSEYSDAWTDEATKAEEHIKSGLNLFEDGSIHRINFVDEASDGSGEMPRYITGNGQITKHDFRSGTTISPRTTPSRKRMSDHDFNANIPVERLSPSVEEFDLQESDSSPESKLLDPDEDRRDENANRGLDSKSKNIDDDKILNLERDRGVAIKGRRMTEVPDGLGVFLEDSNEREHDAERKRKRGAEEEWKFKSARRAGKFRPQALLPSRVEQHGT
ncbi:hypothetical protein KC353_g82 [Hortaea werneckii]|nr:hypothetical protein KC353_g82 [Hortaea werneckii]